MQSIDPGRASRTREPCPRRQIGSRPYRGDALILGAIIAGGRATRFGSDKRAALLDGVALIDHAIAALRPFVEEIVVVGREWPGLTHLSDRPAPSLGPLGGIAAAIEEAERRGSEIVITLGCDMPHIPAGLIATLIANAPAFCPDAPILGAWRNDSAPGLIARLVNDPDRSVRRWAVAIGATPIAAPFPLANINTPADLRR